MSLKLLCRFPYPVLCDDHEMGHPFPLADDLSCLYRSEAGSVIIDKGQASAAPDECRSYVSSRPMQTPEQ